MTEGTSVVMVDAALFSRLNNMGRPVTNLGHQAGE